MSVSKNLGVRTSILVVVLCFLALTTAEEKVEENQIVRENVRKIQNSEQLLNAIIDDCFMSEGDTSSMTCLRMKVLSYLDSVLGSAESRSLEQEKSDSELLDNMIYSRVSRYLKSNQFKIQLPDFLFQRAVLTFKPGSNFADFDIEFPKVDDSEDRSLSEARGILKKKLLLPLLVLLKLKMKTLMPIWLAIVDLKALKALILSKLALALIIGFIVVQMCKKAGMNMPMMPMVVEPTPPAPPTPYGAPAPAPPSSSYEPGWDTSSSSGGPYSRVWDPHQVAYNAYFASANQQPSSQQTSSSQTSQQTLKF